MKLQPKKMRNKFINACENAVRKATTKAVPIIKSEAGKLIEKGTEKRVDDIVKCLTILAIGTAIFRSTGSSKHVEQVASELTHIYIENLTINF